MFLGIDCGTQGTKALLIDRDGNALGSGYAPHALIERPTGAREQQPQWWMDAAIVSVRAALTAAGRTDVEGIGVSGQQHGLVVLDEHMEVIRPAKLWNDTETAGHNAALIEKLGGRSACFERFGIIPLTGYTVSKLAWMAEREPASFARIRHILLPHEYLNFWLTGTVAAEYGDASGTAFFDVRTRTWLRDVLDIIDGGTGQLFRALPPLLAHGEPAGTLRAEAAHQLGLAPGALVSSGGGDNMMGAIGTGNVCEGIVTLSLGTSSTVYSFREQPVLDPAGCVAPFCSSTGGWLPLVCTMNATNIVTSTLTLLGKTVADLDAMLDASSPGAGGLTLLPFLNGERTPDLPDARGALLGVSANNFTAANFVRAAVEGVSFGILRGLDLILEGAQADRIRLIGGGARSARWRQLLADASGATIEVPIVEEAGCLGAAMQAMHVVHAAQGAEESFAAIAARCVKLDAAKTASPNSAKAKAYARARALYRERLRELYGV